MHIQNTLENDMRDMHQCSKKMKQLADVLEEERELDSLAAKYGSTEIFATNYRRVKAQIAKLKLELSGSSPPIVISDDEGDADDGEEDDAEEDEDCMEIDSESLKREESVEFEPMETRRSTRSRRRVSPSPSEYRGSPVESNHVNDEPKRTRRARRRCLKLTEEQLTAISSWKVKTGHDKYIWKEVCKTIPSLHGLDPKRVSVSFDSQRAYTLKLGKPWPY
ncbi:hypothetical protein CALVIDRAFT_541626 [Calocera viscosa TUFC12733]|uniref:Uncharacterized protein n=1 Tax=Calocera viscosa (strain TUFC12733) TaxID=1330018 RepID=A0A167HKJ1_CALVF|nr:hypothetical protein CALVIDRAFT_541626 [Calocera viscosa TUFC12733]